MVLTAPTVATTHRDVIPPAANVRAAVRAGATFRATVGAVGLGDRVRATARAGTSVALLEGPQVLALTSLADTEVEIVHVPLTDARASHRRVAPLGPTGPAGLVRLLTLRAPRSGIRATTSLTDCLGLNIWTLRFLCFRKDKNYTNAYRRFSHVNVALNKLSVSTRVAREAEPPTEVVPSSACRTLVRVTGQGSAPEAGSARLSRAAYGRTALCSAKVSARTPTDLRLTRSA